MRHGTSRSLAFSDWHLMLLNLVLLAIHLLMPPEQLLRLLLQLLVMQRLLLPLMLRLLLLVRSLLPLLPLQLTWMPLVSLMQILLFPRETLLIVLLVRLLLLLSMLKLRKLLLLILMMALVYTLVCKLQVAAVQCLHQLMLQVGITAIATMRVRHKHHALALLMMRRMAGRVLHWQLQELLTILSCSRHALHSIHGAH